MKPPPKRMQGVSDGEIAELELKQFAGPVRILPCHACSSLQIAINTSASLQSFKYPSKEGPRYR